MLVSGGIAVAKKAGRKPGPPRNDQTTKINRDLLKIARALAVLDGKSLGDYLNDLLAPILKAEWEKVKGRE